MERARAAVATVAAQVRLHRAELLRIERMRAYAELNCCRREYLLQYFGERRQQPCGFCDNCEQGISSGDGASDSPFALNSRVLHCWWGAGLVEEYEADKVIIRFDSVGRKKLSVPTLMQRALLRAIA